MAREPAALMLILAMASLAGAGSVDMMIVSRGEGPEPVTQPIDPTMEITLGPSEWVDMDIFYTAEPPWTLISLIVDLVVDGPATLDLTSLTVPPEAWDPFESQITENVAGKEYTIEYYMRDGIMGHPEGNPVIALDHILLHCDGQGDVTVTMTNNTAIGGGTQETDWMSTVATPVFGGPVMITQIPEPITIALLALGIPAVIKLRGGR